MAGASLTACESRRHTGAASSPGVGKDRGRRRTGLLFTGSLSSRRSGAARYERFGGSIGGGVRSEPKPTDCSVGLGVGILQRGVWWRANESSRSGESHKEKAR